MLRTPEAVRERCHELLGLAEDDGLAHFRVHANALGRAAEFVADTIRSRYPHLDIPFHSRWRHFSVGGHDRWRALDQRCAHVDLRERSRAAIDLAVVSVLLDAGAGERWRYRESETGECYSRSEGLAVASFRMFEVGLFSGVVDAPWRADAHGLESATPARVQLAMQVDGDNPMAGIEGRCALLTRLARTLRDRPAVFGPDARIGNLFDYLTGIAEGGTISAALVLETLLGALGPIWPGRLELEGENLGDVWRHPGIQRNDSTDGLVPFHKLSQWLTYSLVEPLQWAGLTVEGLDRLTGLAEYRNGGLFVDLDVIELRDGAAHGRAHAPDSELVVEWRALTVALLDRIAPLVWDRLGLGDVSPPLIRLLEGGTWSAGRRIAAELRPEGGPPISILSDGTVF